MIDFETVKAGDCKQKYLFIKNTSGIDTKVSLEIKNFVAEEHKRNHEEFIDPMKIEKKLCDKFKLKDYTNGIGFALENKCIFLPAFGIVSVSIAAITEMWGSYEDILIINVDGFFYDVYIPIKINVIDTPIRLYTGKVQENEDEEVSMIRFGSQVMGAVSVNRKLKIQNLSWLPIEIDWKVFVVDSNDERLIDLNFEFRDLTPNEGDKQDSDSSTSRSNRKDTDMSTKTNSPIVYGHMMNNNTNKNNNAFLRDSVTTLDYYESCYIYVERVPLIKVNITNHFGSMFPEDDQAFLLSKNKIVS